MINKNDLNKSQLKYFNREDDDEQREIVLHALNRKPIHKNLKCGLILDASYDYINGMIAIKAALSVGDKVLWNNVFMSDSWEESLDGYETRGRMLELVYNMLWDDICDDEGGYWVLKALIG